MTRRVVSVWLTHWRTDRLERQAAYGGPPKPRVIFQPRHGGDRVVALNRLAAQEGLRVGLLLTDAKAILPTVQAIPSDPVNEELELERLGRWCVRFSPWVALDPPDGLWLDVTGVPHLFGGEKSFLQMLKAQFDRLQLSTQLAMADTSGAAWGFARFGKTSIVCIPSGEQRALGTSLPVEALRLDEDEAGQLKRLGLKSVGQLYQISTHNLRPRFGKILMRRLEQFLYTGRETLSPLIPEPEYFASMRLPEPIGKIEDIQAASAIMIERIAKQLAGDGKGACSFTLSLYGAMGGHSSITVKACEPTKDEAHITRLFQERLQALANRFDPKLDADAFSLHASEVSALQSTQNILTGKSDGGSDMAALIDRLHARLGRGAVKQFQFRESHIPEQAVQVVPYMSDKRTGEIPTKVRPLLLLPRPELISAIAEVPDYPPRRFEWRYQIYHIAKAEGPERIAPEWWHESPARESRDYYCVEDKTGARFWLFRQGLYGRETDKPQWYIHGVFP